MDKQQEQFDKENYIRGTRQSLTNTTITYPISMILDWYKTVICNNDIVWDDTEQSKLIESILLHIPINILFINMIDERLNIIDGSQRIAAINRFVTNDLILCGLEVIPILNSSTFRDLLPSRQKRFMKHPILVCELPELINKTDQIDIRSRFNK